MVFSFFNAVILIEAHFMYSLLAWRSMVEQAKLLKKVRRKQAQLRSNEPEMRVTFLDTLGAAIPAGEVDAQYSLFVGNGGTKNGISRELLNALLCSVDALYMPESKDFSFATVTGQRKTVHLLEHCNGISVQEACKIRGLSHLLNPSLTQGPPLHLYLSLVDQIPANILDTVAPREVELPPGLTLIPEFISVAEEKDLLSYFGTNFTTLTTEDSHQQQLPGVTSRNFTDKTDVTEVTVSNVNPVREGDCAPRTQEWLSHSSCTGCPDLSAVQPTPSPVASTLKHRTVSHYGYEFLYETNTVDPAQPLPGGIPDICTPLLERMESQRYLEWLPDQLTVNNYLPGAGRVLYHNSIQWSTYSGTSK